MRKLPERLAESYRACRVSTGNGTHPTPKLATELRNGLKPSAVRLVAALHHIHQQTEGLSFDKMLMGGCRPVARHSLGACSSGPAKRCAPRSGR